MEDILLEPVELTEDQLEVVAGGGCGGPPSFQPNPCGCDDLVIGIGVAVGVVVAL